ncbi:MAG: hypothetical protein OXF49_02810 [Candidatus Saccharibacteria bacterium]|nr:hypothetical protein [Candidatus Saccharibacteria bacterium]
MIKRENYDADGNSKGYEKYEYDADGNQIKSEWFDGDGKLINTRYYH